MFKSVDEVQALSKDGFEAYVTAVTVMTKGLQSLAQETADFSRKMFERNTQTFQKIMAAGSVESAFEVQKDFVKESYDTALSQFTKVNELYTAVVREAYRPLEAQAAKVAAKA
jgi:phasin family protein